MEKVQIITQRGMVLELPLEGSAEGYLVKNIDGLDPNKATLVSSPFALLDGEEYQASRGEKRDIIFDLGYTLNHASSIAVRRRNIYNYLMPQSEVTLRFFMDGMPPVDIQGVVESCDAPQFTKEPAIKSLVSCHRPEFYTQETLTYKGATTSTATSESITYGGSIKSGFLFKLVVPRGLSGLTINHNFSNGVGTSLEYAGALVAGDVLEIETNARAKGAYLTRGGVRKSVLYAVAPTSNWIELYPGQNTMQVYAAGAPIPYTLEYREKFGGL